MKELICYTDGSCTTKGDKLGGFGVYCLCGNDELIIRRGYSNTTTARMEMRAVLAAIKLAVDDTNVKLTIISDSQFIVNSFKENWINKWRINNWRGVKNADLWKQIVYEIEKRPKMNLKIIWMHGHGKDLNDEHVFGNNVADSLADYKTQDSYEKDFVENGTAGQV